MNVKPVTEITHAEFAAYERVRRSGVTNMLSRDVEDLADIDSATHLGIMTAYESLCAKWPDVRTPAGQEV